MNEEQSIDKNSIIPIYYQLAKLLEGQILRGELKPGEALLTETEIANRFEISRMTVRRAIGELIKAGMVHSQQGKGTFVSSPKLNNVVFELNNFNQEVKEFGLKLSTTLLGANIVRADENLMRVFQLENNNTRLLYFRTVVSADKERLAYEKKYTIYSKSKPILESNLKDPTLSGLVTANNDVLPVSTKRILQVSVTTAEEAAILGIAVNAPIFVIEETLYDLENKPVGWSKSIYRGDRYQLTGNDGWLRKDNHGGVHLG